MTYQQYLNSVSQENCPQGINVYLQAMWFDARGDWHKAHDIVQNLNDGTAARIHAYLHRKEGDDFNAKYWHKIAGSVFPKNKTIEEEWSMIVRQLFKIV